MSGVSGPTSLLALLVALLAAFGDGASDVDWNQQAKETLKSALNLEQNWGVAKNVILMIGDGMSVATVTTSRIYDGQNQKKLGEEHVLIIDQFPNVAHSKTYDATHQTADSAATATAILCGAKAPTGTIGMTQYAERLKCKPDNNKSKPQTQTSILDWSLEEGKAVGVVTTTRITHATPGSSYAHTPERTWESDGNIKQEQRDACGQDLPEDVASQLVTKNPNIKVLLGGGRRSFFSETVPDLEYSDTKNGTRVDGRNLVEEWIAEKEDRGVSHAFVWNDAEFQDVDPAETEYLLGLFEYSHMQYETDRENDPAGEPRLTDMVEKAIGILSSDEDGFFLLVESGRIDHAHHDGNAKRAMEDTIEFMSAIQKAIDMTDEKETLLIVTADHSHVYTMGGYSLRGNPILGTVDEAATTEEPANDNATYLTLMYANGPGPMRELDLADQDTTTDDYLQTVAVQVEYETHGGEDVAIYARGPMSHLFYGTHEQNYIAHVMAYASCVGANKDHCEETARHETCPGSVAGPPRIQSAAMLATIVMVLILG